MKKKKKGNTLTTIQSFPEFYGSKEAADSAIEEMNRHLTIPRPSANHSFFHHLNEKKQKRVPNKSVNIKI